MTWQDAQAFAALEAILSGEWDRYLIRLKGGIRQRMASEGYLDFVKNILIKENDHE